MAEKMAGQMIENWVSVLRRWQPFSQMQPRHVRALVLAGTERYARPGAHLFGPENGVPQALYWLRQGSVTVRSVNADAGRQAIELEAGNFWPVAAVLAQRVVTSVYEAREDCFYLCFPWPKVQEVMQDCPVLTGFLQHQVQSVLQASMESLRQVLQQHAEHADFDMPLSVLPAKPVLICPDSVSVQVALEAMQQRKVGSVLLASQGGSLSGILTRSDVLDRIVLRQVPLHAPVSQVMSSPVHAIGHDQLVADAVLLMAQRGVRHLPVVAGDHVVNLVSERDLFALHKKSLRHVSGCIVEARSLAQLQQAAAAIRGFAVHLMTQGIRTPVLTRLISQLNDKLTRQIIDIELAQAGLSRQNMCWVALGSEGREEQTISTDQDNALVFSSEDPDRDRPRWMDFARKVNQALDACGYPLCRGGVMASQPEWCRTAREWTVVCSRWIESGGPVPLLRAAVFFDLRALAGQVQWVQQLRQHILQQVQAHPLFLQQWVANHVQTGVALNWHGGLAAREVEGQAVVDIKLSGSAIVVDAARIMALSQGIETTSTQGRLLQAGQALGIPEAEVKGWITAFDFLQTLRLRQQILADTPGQHPNALRLEQLNQVDRQMLKIALHAVGQLQQRLRMDYQL